MATWSSFAVTAAVMRAKEPEILGDMTDAEVIALFQTQAKAEMLIHLQDLIQFETSTDGDFEDILTAQSTRLMEALASKQLSLYFLSLGGDYGSFNRFKGEYYESKYETYKQMFRSFSRSVYPAGQSVIFKR